jgi:hypothetical protein
MDIRKFLDGYAIQCARRQASHVEAQLRLWMRCGYDIEDLVVVYRAATVSLEPFEREQYLAQVWPRSMLKDTD